MYLIKEIKKLEIMKNNAGVLKEKETRKRYMLVYIHTCTYIHTVNVLILSTLV